MVAVHILQPLDDLSQWEGLLLASNIGGFGQLEHGVQVLQSGGNMNAVNLLIVKFSVSTFSILI